MQQSPLVGAHRALHAKLVPFGGWEMPLDYGSTIDEHLTCRKSAVMFDVSHLGTVRVAGPGSRDLLQQQLSNDLTKIGPGRAQYTHLLDDADGSVIDDIIVWWHPAEDSDHDVFDVMPNASNTDRVIDAIGGRDTTHDRAVIAIQGPEARAMVDRVVPAAAAVARFRVGLCDWNGATCTVAGTGYTGEDGIEISIARNSAEPLWDALLNAEWLRPASVPGTPCVSRPGSRCTATSWAPASRRCRPAWSG